METERKKTSLSTEFIDAFQLSGRGVICIYGGGGKTSLMFTLASFLTKTGNRVLTTTTTKIFFPETGQAPRTIICRSADDLIKSVRPLLENHPLICAAGYDPTPLRTEHPGSDQVVVFGQRENPLAGRNLPDDHGGVFAGGGDVRAVGAERYAPDVPGVSDQLAELAAGRRLPEYDLA